MGFIVLLLLIPGALSHQSLPVDCSEVYDEGFGQSGVYTVYPAGAVSSIKVYCDMTPTGKWTVLQRRTTGEENFYRGWNEYKLGFGVDGVFGDHWLGLESMHLITETKHYKLRIELTDFSGRSAYAEYSSFAVTSEGDGYRLRIYGFINGGAGDSLTYHNGAKFSTYDRDQDSWYRSCAQTFLGGWWFRACHYSNLNGLYLWGRNQYFGTGATWATWGGHGTSLKSITMKIKPA